MSTQTHEERVLQGRAGALKSWALTPDRAARTAAARAAKYAKYEAQVDPDGTLPPEERARRAEQLYKAAMAELARSGLAARRKNAAAKSPR